MKDIKNYTLGELKGLLSKAGYPGFSAQQIFGWIYKKRVEDFELMTDISKDSRIFLKKNFKFSKADILKQEKSLDGTEKFLFKLEDLSSIETVFIPERKRSTLCISTQVGCKYRCGFCASGFNGFKRNLRTCEMINQYLQVCDSIPSQKITNIVFMGIGEPLDNFDNLIKTIEILTAPKGLAFSKKKISISTCGLVPQIDKLSALNLGVKLSVSLHSADEAVRSKLMPINKKYPLGKLFKSVKGFIDSSKEAVTFEYLLIEDINVGQDDARRLAKALGPIKSKLNLILYNDSSSEFKAPGKKQVDNFKEILLKAGIFFTLRKPRGQDISAACGQLRARYKLIR